MPTYAVINKALAALQDPPKAANAKDNEARVYGYVYDAPLELQGMEFSTHDHVVVPDVYVGPVVAPIAQKRVTKLNFRNRFSISEKIRIEMASLDDPTATLDVRMMQASIRVFHADLNSATPDPDGTSIDLNDPRTILAVNTLGGANLLDHSGRVAEILEGE